jgi:hypothetical protein
LRGRTALRSGCVLGRAVVGVAAATGSEERLTELGIELPGLQPAMGNYLAAKTIDNLVFVSGHGPIKVDGSGRVPGKISRDITVPDDLGAVITGKVGSDISVEEAREAARLTGLFLLAALRTEVRSLDRVQSVLKVFGMVTCAPGSRTRRRHRWLLRPLGSGVRRSGWASRALCCRYGGATDEHFGRDRDGCRRRRRLGIEPPRPQTRSRHHHAPTFSTLARQSRDRSTSLPTPDQSAGRRSSRACCGARRQ